MRAVLCRGTASPIVVRSCVRAWLAIKGCCTGCLLVWLLRSDYCSGGWLNEARHRQHSRLEKVASAAARSPTHPHTSQPAQTQAHTRTRVKTCVRLPLSDRRGLMEKEAFHTQRRKTVHPSRCQCVCQAMNGQWLMDFQAWSTDDRVVGRPLDVPPSQAPRFT